MERTEELARREMAQLVRAAEEEAQADAKRRARNLVADALQRVAAAMPPRRPCRSSSCRSDDMKGRIIGREAQHPRSRT